MPSDKIPLTDDQVMDILMESPFFDQVEAELRGYGRTAEADALLKVQQDAGVQYQGGFDVYDPNAGPETAKFDAAFEPVTRERMNAVLVQAAEALPRGPLMTKVIAFTAGKFFVGKEPALIPSVEPVTGPVTGPGPR